METLLPRTEFMITMINILCQMWSWNWFSVTANWPHVQWLKCNIELRACFVVAIWYWILLCHIITLNNVVIKSASNICWCQFHYHITYPASIASPPREQTSNNYMKGWLLNTFNISMHYFEPLRALCASSDPETPGRSSGQLNTSDAHPRVKCLLSEMTHSLLGFR